MIVIGNGRLLIHCEIPPPTRWTRILVTVRCQTPRWCLLVISYLPVKVLFLVLRLWNDGGIATNTRGLVSNLTLLCYLHCRVNPGHGFHATVSAVLLTRSRCNHSHSWWGLRLVVVCCAWEARHFCIKSTCSAGWYDLWRQVIPGWVAIDEIILLLSIIIGSSMSIFIFGASSWSGKDQYDKSKLLIFLSWMDFIICM
jgi:hypothetical protein